MTSRRDANLKLTLEHACTFRVRPRAGQLSAPCRRLAYDETVPVFPVPVETPYQKG